MEWLSITVSIFSVIVSALVSILICFVQIKNAKEEAAKKYEHDKELLKDEFDAKIKQIREEAVCRAGTQILSDVANNTVNAVLESPAVKNEINRQASNSIRMRNSRNRNRKNRHY